MDTIVSYIKDIFNNISFFNSLSAAPFWLRLLIPASVIAGLIVALRSKEYINRLFWIVLVLSIPVVGTLIELAAIKTMKLLYEKDNSISFDYGFNSKLIIVPVVLGILTRIVLLIMGTFDSYKLNRILDSGETKLLPATVAMLAVFLLFLSDYKLYRNKGVYVHLVRKTMIGKDGSETAITDNMAENYAGRLYGKKVTEETQAVIPTVEYAYKAAKRYFSGKRKSSKKFGNEKYEIDFMLPNEFTSDLDIENASYCGMGMVRFSVLKWINTDGKPLKAKRMVYWYKPASFTPYFFELITSLVVMTGIFTPLLYEGAVRFTERVIDMF